MAKHNDRICPRCFAPFSPTDPARTLCIECHLAAQDARRVREGRSLREEKPAQFLYEPQWPGPGGSRTRGSFDDRLREGFSLLQTGRDE